MEETSTTEIKKSGSSKSNLFLYSALTVAGGIGVLIALFYSNKTRDNTIAIVRSGGKLNVRCTGYWPSTATASERKMEGGNVDRRGHVLYTLEEHLADPKAAPFVSVSGDDAAWPYGARISIDEWPTAIFRVVDTGRNFRGSTKVYRAIGWEPLDICVHSSATKISPYATATVYPGDNFEGGKAISTANIKNQTITGTDDGDNIVDGYTNDDYEALARMIMSERGTGSSDEQHAIAWATKNRASRLGVSIHDLLAPEGVYGPQGRAGGRGYASTRQEATDKSRAVAEEVLDSTDDPTNGAYDFWEPNQQNKLKALGDLYRDAVSRKDDVAMKRYKKFRGYVKSEADVRADQAQTGMKVVRVVGSIELLKKTA